MSQPPVRGASDAERPSTPPPALSVAALLDAHPVVGELARRFADAGHTLALVGGPVRDLVLQRQSNDLDFTTSARP